MSPKKGKVAGCGTGIVVLIIGVTLLALLAPMVHAQEPWDKSSIKLNGQCLADGSAEFVVTNGGQDMAGPSAWREYEADVLTQNGEFTLAADGTQVWTFVSNGVPIRFEADQRPGHQGNSHPKLTLTCERPSAVTLRMFSATSTRLLGVVCQRGVVVDFLDAPVGHVVFVVRSGKAFADSYWTVRHYKKTQRVTVCAGVVS